MVEPLEAKRMETPGLDRINLATVSPTAPSSAAGDFKNFSRTGVLKKRSATSTAVSYTHLVRRFQPYDRSLPALQGIGYKEMLAHLDGRCTLAEAVAAVKQASRRYAKRQLTWFRRDPAVEWTDDMNTVHKKIVAFLE